VVQATRDLTVKTVQKAADTDEFSVLFTRSGRALSRREAAAIIRRIAAQANAYLPEDEKINVLPHILRHTFLRKLAEAKGGQYAREASSHQSDRYIWRYVKPDRQTLADAIDALDSCYPDRFERLDISRSQAKRERARRQYGTETKSLAIRATGGSDILVKAV